MVTTQLSIGDVTPDATLDVSGSTTSTDSVVEITDSTSGDKGGPAMLELESTATTTGEASIRYNTDGSGGTDDNSWYTGLNQDDDFAFAYGTSFVDGNTKMTILNNGNVGIGILAPTYDLQLGANSAAKPTSSAWTIASDARIKTNIVNFTDGLNKIMQIRPVYYEYNGLGGNGFNESGTHIGIIAQEVEEVAPYMINIGKGELNGTIVDDFRTYDSHALSYITVNAIQELKTENDILRNALCQLNSSLEVCN